MKCGIVTFHRAINYGAVLQSYALQQSVIKLGIEPEIIEYHCPFIEKLYRPTFRDRLSLGYIKRMVAVVLQNGTLSFNNKGFECFRNKYLKTSARVYYTQADLKISDCDIYITGSDQVWSPTCAGFDSVYFLSFVEDGRKKNSYAASFGTGELPETLKDEYYKRLCDFNKITVREESGCKIIGELLNRDVLEVPDPTMLLSKEEWQKICDETDTTLEDYILVYTIASDEELVKEAMALSKKEHIKVVFINDRLYKTNGVINLRQVSPQNWVKLFMNAKYVFTNSFHGTAFSINFGVPLHVHEFKNNAKTNGRIYNILKKYQLLDCLNKEVPIKTACEHIENTLEAERLFGFKILSEILER